MTGYWSERIEDGVLIAHYSNPPMNYYVDTAVTELHDMIERWGVLDLRAVILTGPGDRPFITHFSPDQILAGLGDAQRTVTRGPVRNTAVNRMLGRLTELPYPVIAALNGDCMGFGMELAVACDFRIGQQGDHRYGFPEVRLGILPGSGGTQRLSRLVGLPKALDIVLRARVMTPEEALDAGLVTSVAPDAVIAATELAREIAELPALAVAVAKRALHVGFDAPLAAALAIESDASTRAKVGEQAQEALVGYTALPLAERRAWLERAG